VDGILSIANGVFTELLFFSAFWFLVGALDDLLVDIFWAIRKAYRHIRYYRRTAPLNVGQLPAAREPGLLALFVPTWQEASVIGQMLEHCQKVWANADSDYVIYVGCYPNDTATISAVKMAAANEPRVNLVILPHNGPTSKADCLNHLWNKLLFDERSMGRQAKAVFLHDAEDLVHGDELRLFDRLIEDHPAVQLPVLPLAVTGSAFVSGHYCDEFAEAHGKGLVLREALRASVPLAGVGCAIRRDILAHIAEAADGKPFDVSSLTEDYELGFKIGQRGQAIFARLRDDVGGWVCSRAHFPADFASAVRQKARWMTGIALTGWDKIGWRGSIAQKWMLLRDRKAVMAAIVLSAAYLCVVLTGILSLSYLAGYFQPEPLPKFLATILWINLAFLIWRLVIRAIFVTRLYGWRQGLMTFPRSFVANIIAIMAARRALASYIKHLFGLPLRWDKTEHPYFPEAASKQHRG